MRGIGGEGGYYLQLSRSRACVYRPGTLHSTTLMRSLFLRRPLWVNSGRDALKFRCPLYPRKRTFAHAIRMSALGQKAT
jgi:hypothetical protein